MRKWIVFSILALVVAGSARAQAVYSLTAQRVTTTASGVAGVPLVLVPSNPQRKAYSVWNNSGNSAYISNTNAGTCSSSTPDKIQATFTSWEQWGPAVWTGAICAVRNSGTGTYTVREYW